MNFINLYSRTYDQIIQAARSGKQNLAEASKELSSGSDLLLNSVSQSSYTEIIEDAEDYLRLKHLSVWDKQDKRVLRIRTIKEDIKIKTGGLDLIRWTGLDLNKAENLGNLLICLCYKQGYLMDRLLRSKQDKFIREGGFKENLYKKRIIYRNKLA